MREDYPLARWLAGEMSADELDQFKQSPEYRQYARIAEASTRLSAPDFESEPMLNRIVSTPKPRVIRLMDRAWMRAAAAIVLLMGIGWLIRSMLPVSESAGIAQQTSFALPDASQVVLNAGSNAKYSRWNWNRDRRVELQGEAYFKVAKGKKFTVRTALGEVSVLGTQFNVRARGERFEVACFEGRVRVDYKGESRELIPGQSLAFASGQEIPSPGAGQSPGWMQQELRFNRESLQEIVSELNRHHEIEIALENVSTAQLFTGTLPQKDLEQALGILSASYHLEISRSGTKITLSPAR